MSVGATFTQYTYSLTVSTSGNGSVTSTDGFINCPGTCSHSYLSNTQVTLNANPAAGWTLSGWSGACSGTGSCIVTMTQNLSVGATFTQLSYTLTVATIGSGTVTSTDGFINCPGTCSHSYLSNTQVTLNATARPGMGFWGMEWRVPGHRFLHLYDDPDLDGGLPSFHKRCNSLPSRPAAWWTRDPRRRRRSDSRKSPRLQSSAGSAASKGCPRLIFPRP